MEKKSVIKKITGSREALLAIIVIVLFAVVTAISPSFLTPKSLMEMLKNNAVTMVMSLGMLCVMLVGGIDISIMSTLALSGMSIGMLLKYGHITSTLLAFIIAMAIKVSSFDSAPNKDSREIFVNQAGTKEVAQALMDAVLDISGGEGQFAILSATSQSANQNAWIDAMKTIMEGDDKYSKLELVDVVYGDDEPQKSTDQTAALLQNYKDLKVICAPTTVGIAAAAKYLQDNGSSCKLTGLGLPSEMQEYTGDDDSHSCPYFYLWDMQGLGKLSAYTTIALINEDITGAKDDKFTAGDLGDYTVTEADDGGTEVVLGAPLKFDTSNIEEMAKLY